MRDDTFRRLYQIGGADLTLRYAEISAETSDYEFRIRNLRLFEGGASRPAENERVFATRFAQGSARYVYFQVEITNPWKYTETSYRLVAKYYKADGSLMGTIEDTKTALPDWQTFWHCHAWGWEEAGHWPAGRYRIEVQIDDKDSASEWFEIYEELPRIAANPLAAFQNTALFGHLGSLRRKPAEVIEEIIGASTPAQAGALALQHEALASQTEFGSKLTALTNEELKARGKTRRFYALNRLSEYHGVLARRQLMSGIGFPEELPELLVTSGGTEDLENEDLRPDSFKTWFNYLRSQRTKTPEVADGGNLSDIDRMRLASGINDRLLAALGKVRDRAAADATIRSLNDVIHDCDKLLRMPASKHFKPEAYNLELKKADARKYIADVEAFRGKIDAAKKGYEAAAEQYRAHGRPQSATRCQLDAAALDLNRDFDAALRQMRSALDQATPQSLEAAEALTSLGEAYSGVNEDQEALRYFKQAEKALKACGLTTPPKGLQIAQTLTAMLMADNPGGLEADKFSDQNAGGDLYRRIYRGFEKIYRRQGNISRADSYLREIEDTEGGIRDGSQSNLDFSNEMLKNLDAIMNKWLK